VRPLAHMFERNNSCARFGRSNERAKMYSQCTVSNRIPDPGRNIMIKTRHIIVAFGIWGQLAPLHAQVQVPKLTQSYRGNFFDINWVDKLERNGRPFADYSSLSPRRSTYIT
jgi:hypothetical protein